jgi:hypothetical protein
MAGSGLAGKISVDMYFVILENSNNTEVAAMALLVLSPPILLLWWILCPALHRAGHFFVRVFWLTRRGP